MRQIVESYINFPNVPDLSALDPTRLRHPAVRNQTVK
jgi:hypothetical protein